MTCRACSHPRRAEIDRQIVAGVPLRTISAETGLSLGGLSRHKVCIKGALADAIESGRAERATQSSDLLDRVHKLADEAVEILATARSEKNLKAATAAICAAVRCLELCGRLDGSLAQPTAPGLHLTLNKTINVYESGSDKEIAELIREATGNWNPVVIERFKQLAGCTDAAPRPESAIEVNALR